MISLRDAYKVLFVLLLSAFLGGSVFAAPQKDSPANAGTMQKHWLFVWRDMSDPKEVDRMIARVSARP